MLAGYIKRALVMSTNENNQEVIVDTQNNEGEGQSDSITISKKDYDTLNQSLGSLKRELKDIKKAQESKPEVKNTPTTNQPDNKLLQKSFLRAAGITDAEEVDLALSTAKKWGVEVDSLVDDEDFQAKLNKLRTTKANRAAVADVKGSNGTSNAKLDPSYWVGKGTYPTSQDVPDRKARVAILSALHKNATGSGKIFYNE